MLLGCTSSVNGYTAVAEAGFDYVELPCKVVAALERGSFSRLCRQVERAGAPVLCMNAYCPAEIVIAGPGFDLALVCRYARDSAKRAAALGVKAVGIGSPRSRDLPDGFNRETADRQLWDFLRATAEAYGRHGITVCFEALGPCFCNYINRTGEAVEAVREAARDNLGIVLDFYNMEHSGEADLDFAGLLPYLRHAHLSDDDGDPLRRSYLHPGRYPRHADRIRRLRACGYDRTLTLETDIPHDGQRARRSLAFLREAAAQPPAR